MERINDFVLKAVSMELNSNEVPSRVNIDFSNDSQNFNVGFEKIKGFSIIHRGVELYTWIHEETIRNSPSVFMALAFKKKIFTFDFLCEQRRISSEHQEFIENSLMVKNYVKYVEHIQVCDSNLLRSLVLDFNYEIFEDYENMHFSDYYSVAMDKLFDYIIENKNKYIMTNGRFSKAN